MANRPGKPKLYAAARSAQPISFPSTAPLKDKIDHWAEMKMLVLTGTD